MICSAHVLTHASCGNGIMISVKSWNCTAIEWVVCCL